MGWHRLRITSMQAKKKPAAGRRWQRASISNTAREEVYRIQRRHHIWEEETADTQTNTGCL